MTDSLQVSMNNQTKTSRDRDGISHLPEDLIVHIAIYAGIADVFALKQTCRILYRLTESDYLWHQILPHEELPLDVSPFSDFRKFSASELRASAIRALKLRANWSKKNPQVRGLYVANPRAYDGTFDELKLLNSATILLGIHRDRHSQRPSMVVCAYTLLNVQSPHLIAQFSIPAAMKDFDACAEDEGTTLILAATVTKGDTEALEVYSVQLPLDTPTICNGAYDTPYSFVLRREGLFHKVSLHGDFIASSIMNHALEEGGHSSQVLIANWKTRQQITINPHFTDNIDQMDVKVLPSCLAIVAASVSKAQVSLVPLDIIIRGGVFEQPVVSKAKQNALPHFPSIVVPLMDFYDICISDNVNFGPHVPPTSLSLIVFPTLSRLDVRQSKKALHLRFSIGPVSSVMSSTDAPVPLDDDVATAATISTAPSIALDVSTPFDIPVGSYPEHAHLGSNGRRGVWLEQSLKSDYVQLLRLDYDPMERGPPSVSVLLPPEPQLPFKPSSCRALAFDEATGRLCIGLYNGAVYILDYV